MSPSDDHRKKLSESLKSISSEISKNVKNSWTEERRKKYAEMIRSRGSDYWVKRNSVLKGRSNKKIEEAQAEIDQYDLVIVPESYRASTEKFQVYKKDRPGEIYLSTLRQIHRYRGRHPADHKINRAKTRVERGQTKYPGLVEFCRDHQVPYSTFALMYKDRFPKGENEENGDWYRRLLEMHNQSGTSLEAGVKSFLTELGIRFRYNRVVGDYRPDFMIEGLAGDLILEVDGSWWHSERIKADKKYHWDKRKAYWETGVRLLAFSEFEWDHKRDIVISMIKHKLGRSRRVYARNTALQRLESHESSPFFNVNHLKGPGRGHTLALISSGKVLCAVRYYTHKGQIVIDRFCNSLGTVVVGGYNRLISNLPNPDRLPIMSYVDCRHGDGRSLREMGFMQSGETLGWEWTDGYKRFNRLSHPGNSGYESGLFKIYDYGQLKFLKVD